MCGSREDQSASRSTCSPSGITHGRPSIVHQSSCVSISRMHHHHPSTALIRASHHPHIAIHMIPPFQKASFVFRSSILVTPCFALSSTAIRPTLSAVSTLSIWFPVSHHPVPSRLPVPILTPLLYAFCFSLPTLRNRIRTIYLSTTCNVL